MNFIINEQLLVSILNYLSNQPFKDVVGLIQGLQAVKPIKQEEEENKDADNSRS